MQAVFSVGQLRGYMARLTLFCSGSDDIAPHPFFLNLWGGTLGTAATTGLLYQPRMIGDGDCGEIDGMKIGKTNRSTRRKPGPAPLCPPQIPHD
jgi:hypothetical protein